MLRFSSGLHRKSGEETPDFRRGRKRRFSSPNLTGTLPVWHTAHMSQTLTRTICCKLAVDSQDATTLAATQCAFNAAASWVAQVCWAEGLTNTNTAHHRVYGETRERFGLGAQLAVCARMKAVEAITAVRAKKRDTNLQSCPQFGSRGSVRYDARSYTLMGHERVSLNTLAGRVTCRLVLGERQRAMLKDAAWEIGGADLVWRRGIFYLHVTASREAPDPSPAPHAGGTLGVDLGIVNLATDSEGQRFTGARIHVARTRYHAHRQRLQACGTRSAKQRLRRVAGREARFQKDTNHCISKTLVTKALVARKALALEDLSGIRERTTVRRAHRYERHAWAFFQLRVYIAYKAAWAGILVFLVDPRNTSRTCSRCGHCDKANRKSQAEFSCQRCGYGANADVNAAINIARLGERAAVNQPIVSPRKG
jgi:putative transposase